jgi:hypothetical protein
VITIGMFLFLFNGDIHKNLNTNFLYLIILVILYQMLQVDKLILFSIGYSMLFIYRVPELALLKK